MLLAPVALMGLASGAEAQDAACFDPAGLPGTQKSLRQSFNFKMASPDPKKHCSLCAFFTASTPGCGKCQLMSGGPVTANSVCDSWAAKS